MTSGQQTWEKLALTDRQIFKPGSREQHKHKGKINTITKYDASSEICEDKTT